MNYISQPSWTFVPADHNEPPVSFVLFVKVCEFVFRCINASERASACLSEYVCCCGLFAGRKRPTMPYAVSARPAEARKPARSASHSSSICGSFLLWHHSNLPVRSQEEMGGEWERRSEERENKALHLFERNGRLLQWQDRLYSFWAAGCCWTINTLGSGKCPLTRGGGVKL